MHDPDRYMLFAVLCLRQHELNVHLVDHMEPRVGRPGAKVAIGGWWRWSGASGESSWDKEVAVSSEMEISVGLDGGIILCRSHRRH